MIKRNRRPSPGTCKPACEALDGRVLPSVLGPSPEENPPIETFEPGDLGPTLALVETTPASGNTLDGEVTQLRLRFDRPLDEFSLGASVRLDRLNDGSTLWDVNETLDPDDPHTLVLTLGHALTPGSYRLVVLSESLLSGFDGSIVDPSNGDLVAADFTVAVAEAEAEEEASQTDLGTLGADVLTVPGALDLHANPGALALYRIQISAAHAWWRVGIEVSASREGSTLRPVLAVFTEDGRLLRVSQTGRPDAPDDPFLFAGLSPGAYLIGISGAGNMPGATGGYDLAGGTSGRARIDAGTGAFTLSVVAEPAEAPTSVLGVRLDFADPHSASPTGIAVQFSGPMAPSDLSRTRASGLEVVDAGGRVWPLQAVDYNETAARLDLLFGLRLPAGSYTLRLSTAGGLTDLAGLPPVRNGLPAGELSRFRVEAATATVDPMDLGALYPMETASGLSRSLVLEPGAGATLRLVVLQSGFVPFTLDAQVDAEIVAEAGGAAYRFDGLSARPLLEPGVYFVTLSNPGTETLRATLTVQTNSPSAESLPLNGLGQGPALNLRLIAPTGGLSAAMPATTTPGPATGTQHVAVEPAPWAASLLGLVPGPIATPTHDSVGSSVVPLPSVGTPQSAGGLALGLTVEVVGVPVSHPTIVALSAPASPAAPGLGQGSGTTTALASFFPTAPQPVSSTEPAVVSAAPSPTTDNAAALHALGEAIRQEGIFGHAVAIALQVAHDAAWSLKAPHDAGWQPTTADALAGDAEEDDLTHQAMIDPSLVLTAATVVAIQFRDRIRQRLGQGAHRSRARSVPIHWGQGLCPRVLDN